MTEHQFRDGLKKSVGHIGFSSECQMKVLARMKEGERKVRTRKRTTRITKKRFRSISK